LRSKILTKNARTKIEGTSQAYKAEKEEERAAVERRTWTRGKEIGQEFMRFRFENETDGNKEPSEKLKKSEKGNSFSRLRLLMYHLLEGTDPKQSRKVRSDSFIFQSSS
jgi:hypothetical protein